ncbi:hypothetical protein ACFX13_028772 [Malus domestica]
MDCKGGEGEGRGMAGRSEAAKNGVGEKSSIALSIASVLSHGQDPFTEIEAEAAKVECFNRLYISPSLLVPTAAQQGQVSQQTLTYLKVESKPFKTFVNVLSIVSHGLRKTIFMYEQERVELLTNYSHNLAEFVRIVI